MSEYIEELKAVIRQLHGVESKHVDSVPIKEEHHGKTVWDGVVEVFELIGHPKAVHAYAWAHDADGKKRRNVTVLQIRPIISARDAVRAAIVQEFRSGTAEEA